MDAERFERLEAVMAAIATADKAAVFWLYEEFGGHLAAFMRRELRRLGVEDAREEDLDGLVIDACFELFDCGAAWKPDGGALPWNWASKRLAAVASVWVGQYADDLDEARLDLEPDEGHHPLPSDAMDDEPELDVLFRMAGGHAGCALVLEALARVASRRDQAMLLELHSQKSAGDPSPALTVGRRHNVSPDVVRQAACRVRSRLSRLAAKDGHFAGLADLPIVA